MRRRRSAPAGHNLVVCAIGDGNVCDSWLGDPETRGYDALLMDYRPDPPQPPPGTTHFFARPGLKYEHLSFLAETWADELRGYASIWCPDDDIALEPEEVRRMFELFAGYRLALAQPGIASGDLSFRAFRQQPGTILRFAPFVEGMCPLFSGAAFRRVQHTFALSRSGWGLDLMWPTMFRPREVAILDAIGARHTRPALSGEVYRRLADQGLDPWDEMAATVAGNRTVAPELVEAMRAGTIRLVGEYGPLEELR